MKPDRSMVKELVAAFRRNGVGWTALALGAVSFVFVGWRYNVPLAAWTAPLLLMRFYRDARRWYATLAAIPLLAGASYLQLAGAWDLADWQLVLLPLLRPAVLVGALYVDRALAGRLPKGAATLVFPSVFLALDYCLSITPFATTLSLSATQFGLPAIAQLASLTGIWGIGFLINWTASIANLLWEHRRRPREAGAVLPLFAAVAAAVLLYGGVRSSLVRPDAETVRFASITVAHPRDYWNWIDAATPRALVRAHARELATIREQLFSDSARAVSAGAKIVFWSEGNAVLAPEDAEAFYARAASFARDNRIYLGASLLQLAYGSTVSDNRVVLYAPNGEQAFSYGKAKSWYPTVSDGVLRSIDTPYGRLAAAICFDMDFPGFIQALGRQGADIVLVPAYDSAGIRPYHTEVGIMRAIENGFAVVRQTNEGSSLAVDGTGRILARQEFFETADRTMYADVPTKRTGSLYRLAGDWFAYAAIVLAAVLLVSGFSRRPTGRESVARTGPPPLRHWRGPSPGRSGAAGSATGRSGRP